MESGQSSPPQRTRSRSRQSGFGLLARLACVAAAALAAALPASAQTPLGTAFTYQGRLTDGGLPPSGAYDLQLILYDAAAGGSQVGPTLTRDDVVVTNGLFTVSLDFGAVFAGSRRWLEIGVRPGASTGAYTTLSPRQELSPAPNAAFSATAPWTGVTGKPAGFADNTDNDVLGGLSCGSGQIAKWNGASWACAADADTPAWGLTGNAGTSPATNFIGTTDNQAFELRVGGLRALRVAPATNPVTGPAPNLIGGHPGNAAGSGVAGATIAGGGADLGPAYYNRVDSSAGTIAGGYGNTVSGFLGFVGGGNGNVAAGQQSVVGGGGANTASGGLSTVAGGSNNTATANFATVGGGSLNTASGILAAVPGGYSNVAGGWYSLAGGRRARVRSAAEVGGGDTNGDEGTWVWADSADTDFLSTGPNQFLVRAAGGVGINTNAPASALDVSGTARMAGFRLTTAPAAGYVLTSDVSGNGTWQASAGWGLTGNAGTNPATNFIGTTDNQAFELRANGSRALRLEPATTVVGSTTYAGANVVAGSSNNAITAGVSLATIAGGGGIVNGAGLPNTVTDVGGTVAGGWLNRAGDDAGTLDDRGAATVGGGTGNIASGGSSTIAGGAGNVASGNYSAVAGGFSNTASGGNSAVAGGFGNTASGVFSAVAGGVDNVAGGDFSLAAGRLAQVRTAAQVGGGDLDGDEGTFVWADSTFANFFSTGPNQFLIRAAGGVGINTSAPASALDVNGTARMAGFRLTTAPAAGYVLTSDVSGNGTWQASAGDITGVTAGTGLTGGGTSGAVTLGADFGGSGAAATVSRSDHDHLTQTWSGGSPLAPGLKVVNPGTGGFSDGLWGQADAVGGGRGVVGYASNPTGQNYGVWGQADSNEGRGVFGLAPVIGVFGLASATAGFTYGVYGQSNAVNGSGVFGEANAATGQHWGVKGQSSSTGGRGVYGLTTATTGSTYGVLGGSFSTGGSGVHGSADASTGFNYGVWGQSRSADGAGVFGISLNSVGGYAGYFWGNVQVTGTLSKGGGSFKIDHPLDPENKYLYHSFVESPDMMNIYNGNVTTDAEGFATVELPAWFEALNRDFRYQLTVIGGGTWARVRVAEEIRDGRFVVQSDVPGTKVSWQVTGIRKDAFAEKHRIPVEEDKRDDERGTYLYPEAFGFPKERGLDYKRHRNHERRETHDHVRPEQPKP